MSIVVKNINNQPALSCMSRRSLRWSSLPGRSPWASWWGNLTGSISTLRRLWVQAPPPLARPAPHARNRWVRRLWHRFKGVVRHKLKFHPTSAQLLIDGGSGDIFTFHVTVLEFHKGTEFHLMNIHSTNVLQHKINNTRKILLVWCRPSVQKTWKSNLTPNTNVTTVFWAEISSAAS